MEDFAEIERRYINLCYPLVRIEQEEDKKSRIRRTRNYHQLPPPRPAGSSLPPRKLTAGRGGGGKRVNSISSRQNTRLTSEISAAILRQALDGSGWRLTLVNFNKYIKQ